MMDWRKLLSTRRYGQEEREPVLAGRSPFHKDMDRIVFSSAFRRLQDKTQVHSLPESDYVRTRLTHSMEVASVGRSLGAGVGETVIQRHLSGEAINAADFGHIVSAACLAHDIGNPPFGHFGEDVIRHWFDETARARGLMEGLSPAQQADFLGFEGNAQGFRVLTKLQNWRDEGGLRLTYATLATFTKYPRASLIGCPVPRDTGGRKFGFYQAERGQFRELADEVGLIPRPGPGGVTESGGGQDYWCRHPLAYLVEAADDICYLIVDLEDGFKLGRIAFEEAESLLLGLIGETPPRYGEVGSPSQRISYLRAKAIGNLIAQATGVFIDHEREIIEGRFEGELLSRTDLDPVLRRIYDISTARLFRHPDRLQTELSGHAILTTLLDAFATAFHDREKELAGGRAMPPRSKVLLDLFPEGDMPLDDRYHWLLRATDFISGMTDSYAVKQYRRLEGLLP